MRTDRRGFLGALLVAPFVPRAMAPFMLSAPGWAVEDIAGAEEWFYDYSLEDAAILDEEIDAAAADMARYIDRKYMERFWFAGAPAMRVWKSEA